MSIVDIVAIIVILLGGLFGFKKGTMKGFINLVAIVAIAIVAYVVKVPFENFVISKMPFFEFAGFKGLFTLNIMFYQDVAFVLSFVILYCILNILLDVSGLVDMLTEFTIIMKVPDKIIGVILGAVESLVFVFILGYAMLNNPFTQKFIMQSNFTKMVVERTPVVSNTFALSTGCSEKIYYILDGRAEDYDPLTINMEIARAMITSSGNKKITDVINEQIENGKLHMDNVVFASQTVK